MKGLALIVWFGLASVASIALFNITFKVEKLQDELHALNRQILEEQKDVHVLQAEWTYLSRPERIEALSHRLLPDMQPPAADQVGTIESLSAQTAGASMPAGSDSNTIRPVTMRSGQ